MCVRRACTHTSARAPRRPPTQTREAELRAALDKLRGEKKELEARSAGVDLKAMAQGDLMVAQVGGAGGLVGGWWEWPADGGGGGGGCRGGGAHGDVLEVQIGVCGGATGTHLYVCVGKGGGGGEVRGNPTGRRSRGLCWWPPG